MAPAHFLRRRQHWTASATAATCASPIFRRPSHSRRRRRRAAVEGYGAALCERIAAGLKSQLGLSQLAVDWVPVTIDTAANAVAGGQADVLCTPANATLARRKTLSFSIPIFAGGIRAVVRDDVTPQIREALEDNPRTRPVWRGTPAQGMVEATRFATVAGTSSERWLRAKKASFKLNTATVSVPDYASGIKFLLEDKIDVFFAERDVALAAMDANASEKLRVLNRQITHEPLALALPRGDEDLRLLVDTALSSTYSGAGLRRALRQVLRPAGRRQPHVLQLGDTGALNATPSIGDLPMITRSIKRISLRALIVDDELGTPTAEGRAARALVTEMQGRAIEVIEATVGRRWPRR